MEEASQAMVQEYRMALTREIQSLPLHYQQMKLSDIFDLSSEATMDFKMLLFKDIDQKVRPGLVLRINTCMHSLTHSLALFVGTIQEN